MTKRFLLSNVSLAVLAIGFLVSALWFHYGLRNGKLLGDYLSDDNLYLYQALVLTDGFYQNGPKGFISAYLAEPPHAPLSAILIASVFAIFGPGNAPPYLVLGAGFLGLYLGSLAHLSRDLRLAGRLGVLAIGIAVPFTQGLVLELRPEYGYSVFVALGFVLAITPTGAGRLGTIAAGLAWGAAIAIKPPFAPLTAALFVYTSVGEEWLRRQPSENLAAGAWPRLLIKSGLCGLFALPVLFRAGYYLDYVHTNTYGAQASLWTLQSSLVDRLLFHLTGPGGQRHLGPWISIVVAGTIIMGVYSCLRGASLPRRQLAVLAGGALLTWGIFGLSRANNPHLSAPLHVLLLLTFVQGLVIFAGRFRSKVWFDPIWLFAALGFGLLTFTFAPSRWGSPNDPAIIDSQRVHPWLLEHLRTEQSGTAPPNLFFTFSSKLINTHSFRWVAAREGLPTTISEQRESADWNDQRAGIEQADLIFAAEPGAAAIHGWLPSAQTYAQAYTYLLDERTRFIEIGRFRTHTGYSYVLFRRSKDKPGPTISP